MIGQAVSHYTILEKLGEGGMGVVYKAHDTKLDRHVALKFLPYDLTDDSAEKERFYHEARAAASLTHANIAVVYEIGETNDGQLFIAMEYVEGRTLREFIAAAPPTVKSSLEIAIQICDGLAAAHEKGIVHRDIKPENIIVTPKGQVKITDFGLALLKGVTRLTKSGSTLGTAAYMSPEQTCGERVDHRSDIFSLGVVLYEMLTLHRPFGGEHPAAMQYSIVNEDPPPLARYSAAISDELQHIVSKSLEKDPANRYQHADDMLADLRRERMHGESTRTGSGAAPLSSAARTVLTEAAPGATRKGGRLIKIVAAFGLFALAAIAYLLLKPMLLDEAFSSERRTVAVISFTNQTGDNSYDYLQDAIPNLLITNLEQSKYLRVTTWERLYDLCKQMGKTETRVIDRETGFALCKMDGIDAIVIGSFTKAGDVFATDVKVLDVDSKQLLKSVNSKGDGVGSILRTQIDELSREISRGVGLSERTIAAKPMQIMEVTTSSMEAYNFFLRGRDDYYRFYFDDARKYLEKAVSIDSTFAVAYTFLAFACESLHDDNAAMAGYEKAARYSEKTPERERLMVAAAIAGNVEKNSPKAITLLKEVTEKYPKYKMGHFYLGFSYARRNMLGEAVNELITALQLDPQYGAALNQLAYAYAGMGEYDKAIDCLKRYADANPGDPNPFDSMAELYFKMGKLDDAIAKYNEVLEIQPGFGSTDLCLAYIFVLKEDFDQSLANTDRYIALHSSPGLKGSGYLFRAIVYYYAKGNCTQAMKDIDKAQQLFQSVGDKWWFSLGNAVRALILYERHEPEASRAYFDKFFSYEVSANPLGGGRAGWAYARGLLAVAESRIPDARMRIMEMDSTIPLLSSKSLAEYVRTQREMLHSQLLIAEDSLDEAIRVFRNAGALALPNFSEQGMISYNLPPTRDLAARAYAKKGDLDQAIIEYEKITVFDPAGTERRLILPSYHFALAKLYEKKGLRKKAEEQYAKLMLLWKDADVPEANEARMSLMKLRGGRVN
jgi:eukaryotic-like serine/threonine-protein kinase